MKTILQEIIRQLPALTEEHQKHQYADNWNLLDEEANKLLLGFTKRNVNADYTGGSCIAVVSEDGSRYHLEHMEYYPYDTHLGLLNVNSSHVIIVRRDEYDDLHSERYGWDDLYIVNYQRHEGTAIETYHFGIGAYIAGYVRVTINRKRNWIAFARDERDGWQQKARIVVGVYDLDNAQLISKSTLTDLQSINSLDLPGVGDFLIVTDGHRRDHAYRVTTRGLELIAGSREVHKWQIALSFSGKDRQIAERLALGLKNKGISVFYDQFHRADLLGKDLYQYLFDVYAKQSLYCLILISKNYREDSWPMYELKAIQAAAFQSQREYLLPIRLDDTEIPGLPAQIGYLDYRQESIGTIINLVEQKVTASIAEPEA